MATRAESRKIFTGHEANMEETDGEDFLGWKLTTDDPQERSNWRSGVRSAMSAVSQLPRKGPTEVDDAPAPVL